MKIRTFEKRGIWHLDFVHEGQRLRPSTGCKTEQEALQRATTVMADAINRLNTKEQQRDTMPALLWSSSPTSSPSRQLGGMTFREAFEKGKKEREKWLKADLKTLQSTFDSVVAYWGADRPLMDAHYNAVMEWRSAMREEEGKRAGTKLSASTINHRLSLLSVLLEVAKLPPHGVKHLSTKGNERKRRVREEELRAVQAWLSAHSMDRKGAASFSDLITVALHTTARQGELLALKWPDVYFDRGVVVFRDPKNGEFREGVLTDTAQRILERRLGYGLQGPFTDLNKDRCGDLWEQARKALGLEDDPEFVFHVATRHEGLSRVGETGTNTFMVMAMGGHKSPATSKRYVKPSTQSLRKLGDAIERYNPGL